MADHRPNVYWDGDLLVMRASSLDSCTLSLVYAGRGEEGQAPPDNMLKVFAESAGLEGVILDRVRKGQYEWSNVAHKPVPWKIDDPKDFISYRDLAYSAHEYSDGNEFVVRMPVGEKSGDSTQVVFRGALDALGSPKQTYSWMTEYLRGKTDQFNIEIKALGPDLWKKFVKGGLASMPVYEGQVKGYSVGTGKPSLFVVGEKVDGEIVSVRVEIVPAATRKDRRVIKKRCLDIAAMVTGDKPMPEACDKATWPCPYYHLHVEAEGPDVDEETADALDSLCIMRSIVEGEIADREATLKLYKDKIDDLMVEKVGEGAKVTVGNWKLTQVTKNIPAVKAGTKTINVKAKPATTQSYTTMKETT